ncbi:MAG: hypothetical protein ILP17_04685 [Lachnospiraceae bacterium]|nr:hypothetical protein [Lachnospiraceae bacterium]
MSRHKKKNRNNSRKEDIREQQKPVTGENPGEANDELSDDYTQELTFDLSDFDEAEPVSKKASSEDAGPVEDKAAEESGAGSATDVKESAENAAETGAAAEQAENASEADTAAEQAENASEADTAAEQAGNVPEADVTAEQADNASEADTAAEQAENTSEADTDAKQTDDASEAAEQTDGNESAKGTHSKDAEKDPKSGSDKDSDDKDDDDKDDESDEDDKKKSKDSKVSRNALREQSENERIRREARHKRRIRQQVTAYLLLVIILAAIGCGIFFAVKKIVSVSRARQAEALAQEQAALQQQLEEEAAAAQAQQTVEEDVPPAPTVADLGQTPAQRLDEIIEAEIANMTLEEKVQAIMFITPESITGVDRVVIAGEGTANALSEFNPGGIVYSAKNVTSADQFTTMMNTTLTLVDHPVFLATTETGMDESGLIKAGIIESALTPAQAAEGGNVEEVVSTGAAIGSGLASVGITVNFAPLADLAVTNGGVMADTCYGSDAASITPYVTGMAEGLYQSGVVAAYKYFPSLAAASQNPATGRAVSDRTLEDFRSNEFQVWLSAINAGARMIQMSNVIYPSIDSDSLPSTISDKTVTGVLRDELKYDGVIISGPLSDAAITSYYTASESAVMALKAGCDMIYSSPDPKAAAEGIIEAVGSGVISEERINDALVRIYRIRYADTLEQFRIEYEANAQTMGVDLTGVQY